MDQSYWVPDELAVVIEVVSESSEEDDRFDKPRWYAHAGIGEYWRVEQGEHGEAVIFQHQLARTADGTAAYVRTGLTTLTALEAGSGA
jgi:Uma2 family endonuclease